MTEAKRTLFDNLEDIASAQQRWDAWEPVYVSLKETQAPSYERITRCHRLTLTIAAEYRTGQGSPEMDALAKTTARRALAREIFGPCATDIRKLISSLFDGATQEQTVRELVRILETLK